MAKAAQKSQGSLLLRLGISLAALGGIGWFLRGKLGEAFSLLKEGLQWEWLVLATVIYVIALALISWRFQIVLRVQDVKISFRQSFYLSFVGLFFTLFTPSSLGGDVARGYFASQYSGNKTGSLTGVLLDRLLGFFTIVLIALAALGFYSHGINLPFVKQAVWGALGILISGIVFFSVPGFTRVFRLFSFLIPSEKWRQKISGLYSSIREYRNHPRVLLSSLGLSVIAQLIFLASVYFLSQALQTGVPAGPFFILVPLVGFASMAPSLSGLGVREAGFIFFFKPFMKTEQALALSILYDFIFYGCALAGGIAFAFRGGLKRHLIEDFESQEPALEKTMLESSFENQGGR